MAEKIFGYVLEIPGSEPFLLKSKGKLSWGWKSVQENLRLLLDNDKIIIKTRAEHGTYKVIEIESIWTQDDESRPLAEIWSKNGKSWVYNDITKWNYNKERIEADSEKTSTKQEF